MKVGDEYYEAYVDAWDYTVRVDLWVISAVRVGTVFAIRRTDHTWVKRSSKTGDYGWAASIDQYNKCQFSAATGTPDHWARTKAAAYTKALPDVEAKIKKLCKLRAQMTGQRTKARGKATAKGPQHASDTREASKPKARATEPNPPKGLP